MINLSASKSGNKTLGWGHSAKRTAAIPTWLQYHQDSLPVHARIQMAPVHGWSLLNVTGCPEMRNGYLWLDEEMAYEKAMVHFRRVLYRFLRVACKKMFSGHRIRRTTSASIVETTAIPKPTRSDAS